MKSDIILINNRGNGFDDALQETKRVAVYRGMTPGNTLQLQLLTEEMLSLARSVTGEMKASFWIESETPRVDLHMSTMTVLDQQEREQLLSAASSRKNEIANTFLGRLRDAFEQAMASVKDSSQALPDDIMNDLVNHDIESDEWDGYERSILRRLADDVKIAIRGGLVDMTVSKSFAE